MESTSSFLAAVRSDLILSETVTRFSPNRRFASLFAQEDSAVNVYYLESGLVKLYKRNAEGKEIIIQIVAPGELFGEQGLLENGTTAMAGEILHEGVLHVIPRQTFIQFCDGNPQYWHAFSDLLIQRKRDLEKKIELLCLQDVEYRILYYLAELAGMVGVKSGEELSVPLSQGELASLIGATRETTSTTLNSLARRGLLRLGRRQVVLSSLDGVNSAAADRAAAR